MNRVRVLFIAVFALVAVFIGVFAAVQLMASEPEAADAGGQAVRVFEQVIDDGSGPVTITTVIEPSPELPGSHPDASGVLSERDGDRMLVGTGDISVEVENINGDIRVATDHSGPEVEVLIGPDTLIYEDVTDLGPVPAESGERRLQQSVEPVDTLDELPDAAEIMAWGKSDGGRLTADVLVYRKIR